MLSNSLLQRAILFFALLGALTFSASATALSDVDAVNAALKRAEANLQLVEGAVGGRTTAPKGSAGKLARMRLSQALPELEKAGKLAAGLKSGAGVAEAKARYTTAANLYNKLNGILSGKPAPTPAPKPAPKPAPTPAPGTTPPTPQPAPAPAPKPQTPPAPTTVKLGYPHADNFKNALFTLRRVEKDSNSLIQLMAEVQPIKDQLSIKYGTAAGAVELAKEGTRQAGFAETALAKIPSNGEGVAEAKERLAAAREALKGTAAYFEPLHAKLADLINPANYPQLQADLNRLNDLSQSFRNVDYLLRDDRVKGAATFQQSEASLTECRRIQAAYARLVEQDTDMGRSVKARCSNVEEKIQAFMTASAEARQSLPQEIKSDAAKVQQLADNAVAEQKPMWFTGGIPQQMGWIDDKLALLMVLDPEGSAKTAADVKALKEGLAVQADSLKELIIAENQLPPDSYGAGDRDAIIAIAKDGWKVQEPDFELLSVRIASDTWSRDTRWTASGNSLYLTDVSSVQVRLIVADKANPKQAIIRAINVRKDHRKGDKLYGVPLRSFDEKLQPHEYMLRSRIK